MAESASRPSWRCYGFWPCEVTLLLCKAPHQVPHPVVPGYVALVSWEQRGKGI